MKTTSISNVDISSPRKRPISLSLPYPFYGWSTVSWNGSVVYLQWVFSIKSNSSFILFRFVDQSLLRNFLRSTHFKPRIELQQTCAFVKLTRRIISISVRFESMRKVCPRNALTKRLECWYISRADFAFVLLLGSYCSWKPNWNVRLVWFPYWPITPNISTFHQINHLVSSGVTPECRRYA